MSLTVTDDDGATNTKTSSVTVSSGGGGGTVLQNGVAVTGLSATTGNQLFYTMVVPAGATNLRFATSGGSGVSEFMFQRTRQAVCGWNSIARCGHKLQARLPACSGNPCRSG